MSVSEHELRKLLAEGRKLEAVKLYKEQTGASLIEAKRAVEALGEPQVSAAAEAGSALEQDVLALLQRGQLIEAVRLYRDRTGVSLKAAKTEVESLADGHGLQVQRPGCFGILVAGLFALGAAAAGVFQAAG